MLCEYCKKEMNVINVELNEDKTECRQEHGCVNPKCGAYTGRNTNNPLRSVKGEWIEL